MKIFKISFFNVGNTALGGTNYFDAIKPGLILASSDEEYLLGFYESNESLKIKKLNYDTEWWQFVAKHLISKNKFDTSPEFLTGLLQCSDQEDTDGLYDYCQSEGGKVIFADPHESIDGGVGFFCIKQYIDGDFEYLKDKIKINNKSYEPKDIFGKLDDLTSSLVYVKN